MDRTARETVVVAEFEPGDEVTRAGHLLVVTNPAKAVIRYIDMREIDSILCPLSFADDDQHPSDS
jgi:hypothetical protein